MRTKESDHLDQWCDRLSDVLSGEATLGKLLIVALWQTRVDEAEPHLPDTEDFPGAIHLLAPNVGNVGQDVRTIHRWIEDRSALTAGTGDNEDVHALRDVLRGRRRALTRFIVRMRVHVQEPETFAFERRPEAGHDAWPSCCHRTRCQCTYPPVYRDGYKICRRIDSARCASS